MGARPKVNHFPNEDKDFGGYKDAVRCIHCRRWMVVEYQGSYVSESGKFHHVALFKELTWDGYRNCWYIANRSHSPDICGHAKENRRWAKEQGYKSWGQFKRIMARKEKERQDQSQPAS